MGKKGFGGWTYRMLGLPEPQTLTTREAVDKLELELFDRWTAGQINDEDYLRFCRDTTVRFEELAA